MKQKLRNLSAPANIIFAILAVFLFIAPLQWSGKVLGLIPGMEKADDYLLQAIVETVVLVIFLGITYLFGLWDIFKENAAVEVLQATLGLRLGDTLKLKMCSFIKDGSRCRLDIKEQKTGKMRTFTVPIEVYSFIQDYAISNNIGADAKLFDISERQVERHMNKVFTKMGLPLRQYGTHSARKLFATKVYVENDYNIELVRVLLQHSSVVTTQRYIGIQQKQVEDALAGTVVNLV